MKITLKHEDGSYFHRQKEPHPRMTPFFAHLCYWGSMVLLFGLAWGVHVLDRYAHIGPRHYLIFLPAIWQTGLYVWHCFVKKDYVWILMAIG